jgi:predicted MFS family arabinose efflux permease
MIGGLWFGGRAWRTSLWTRYVVLLLLAVVFTSPLILAHSIAAGALCTVFSGLTIAPVFSCQYALVGHAVTPGTETEAFTWVTAALVTGIAVGSAAGGGLVSAAGVSAAFVFAVGATACAAAMGLLTRARVEGRAEVLVQETL